MAYSAAALLALASQCAPSVAPETVLAIIQTESSGEPFALNVNGGRQPARQSNAVDAASTARRFVAAGYSVDLGLGQINSRNMRWLGLTWETVFDPCTNVAALARVLTTNCLRCGVLMTDSRAKILSALAHGGGILRKGYWR